MAQFRLLPALIVVAAALLSACAAPSPRAPGSASSTAGDAHAAEKRKADAQFAAYFDEYLALNPLNATSIGDPRFNASLPNFIGPDYRARAEAFQRDWLARVRTLDRGLLTGQDRLSYDIFVESRKQALEGMRYPSHLLPISQFFSMPSFFARLGSGQSIQPFRTVDDYEDFMSRMDGMVVWIDQSIANMREGMATGIVQPRVLMEKMLPQLESMLERPPSESVFAGPLASLPATLDSDGRDALAGAYVDKIERHLLPAYARLYAFIHDQYLPACRETVGLSALPDGAQWYAFTVRVNTTTDLSPELIHRIGLEEVARILAEMNEVRRRVGFDGDLPAFFEYLKTDERFYFPTEDALLDGYRSAQAAINARLPAFFDIFPKADYEIRPVEAFRAESAAGASYQAGTPDGKRAGVFYINTFNLKAQPRFIVETLSLHEASPGHHFQVSIQQEIEGLPMFRRFGDYTAYSEGWALYVESIGREMGLFTDPYQYYGRLSDEQLRAMRLVVDTGLHAKGWTREQAIAYMLANSSMAESDVVAEVERYIAIPGQALAYKIGQRAISAMRARAERALGKRFDIRAFHRAVLEDGALPMSVLDNKIDAWIAAQLP